MQYNKILLIDDDQDDQEIFETSLGRVSSDFKFTAFSSAGKALENLRNNDLEVDIIFLDLNMPIMSGQEFLSEIKKDKNILHIPVIIFSTSSNPETIQLTKEMGAVNFITKPDRIDKLVDILKSILL